jgi:hypothetical protein
LTHAAVVRRPGMVPGDHADACIDVITALLVGDLHKA